MESDIKDRGLPFKDFLDKTTNLVTLFGVFNALFIYSTTLESQDASQFLLPSFFVLSILVWLELILFTLTSNDGTKKYELFFFLLCSVEIGLVWYFVVKFAGLLIMLGVYGIFLLLVYLLTIALVKILIRPLAKAKEKRRKNSIFLLMLVAMLLSGLIMKISMPLLKTVIDKISPNEVQPSNKVPDKSKVSYRNCLQHSIAKSGADIIKSSTLVRLSSSVPA